MDTIFKFNENFYSYSHLNSYSMASLCKLVYSDKEGIKAQCSDLKLDCKIIEVDSNRCCIFSSDELSYEILIFRGTHDEKTVLEDLEVLPIKMKGYGLVHKGFYDSTKLLLDELKPILSNKPLVITGHSLGGAQALLSAFILKTSNKEIHSIYTFGQPRIGDLKFMNTFDKLFSKTNYFRVVNAFDLVPKVPLKNPYTHSHIDYYWYSLLGGFEIKENKKKLCATLEVNRENKLKGGVPIHGIDDYIKHIEKNL